MADSNTTARVVILNGVGSAGKGSIAKALQAITTEPFLHVEMLDVLEARERQRGDRLIGLARWQYRRVHAGIRYDLELDTSRATPMQCAGLIKEAFRL